MTGNDTSKPPSCQDTEGRRYPEYSNIYGSYNILIWFAKKYPELYINEDTKETLLHYTAAQGLTQVVKCLLNCGSFPVDVKDENDKTPLHYAALNGADEVFQLLVDNKADIDALDAVGATPLHFAVRWGSESIVKLILRNKGDEVVRVLDSGDRLGRTPLHYAASQKTGLSYITNLLKAGANIDYQDHSGVTPLHLACRSTLYTLLQHLLTEYLQVWQHFSGPNVD